MKAWSHSSLNAFETCPKKYWHLSVRKDVREPTTDALSYGNEVHKAIEQYMKRGTPLKLGMNHYEPVLKPIRDIASQAQAYTELEMALDRDFAPTAWFSEDTWVRAKLDYALVRGDKAALFDWKTGKPKMDEGQLALTAAVMFHQQSHLNSVDSAFVWLQEKPARAITRISYTRNDVPSIWARLLPRVEKYQDAHRRDDFPAKPGFLCRRYCPVASCPYHGT